MAKDVFDSLAGAVPRSIASSGVERSSTHGGRRSDRPLGRQGLDLLAQVPLFEGLPKRTLKQLADHADVVTFNERDAIVEEGHAGGTFYVVVEGEAKVVRRKRTIAHVVPGEFFGEISLLDGGPRTASVIAETPVTTIRIFKRSFDKLVAADPSVASRMLAVVARRLREAERSIAG
ncbi:MAG TPA: cyclic nucleotide-binding domain-containing protein [Actinomycetota bacterium]|nr:cyclic nucleotide-binding domain-containing protein [Actinomycetota bacterium]